MKCSKCGCEFEGKFCPECGTKYEQTQTCPACGAEVSGKFCSNCGHPIGEQKAKKPAPAVVEKRSEPKQYPTFAKKLYAFMPKIFPIMFAVFAVLMMICYVGGVESNELLDELGVSDSVYSYLSSDETEDDIFAFAADDFGFEEEGAGVSLKAVCAALVAFGAFSVLAAAFGLAIAFWTPLATVKFKIGDRALKLSHIVDIFSYILLVAIFILGCILCASVGDEFGFSKPGAAPICIIFFSLFFGLLMIPALIGRKIISYFWKEANDEYEAQKQAARESLAEPIAPPPFEEKEPAVQPVTMLLEQEKEKLINIVIKRDIIAYITLSPFMLIIGSVIAIVRRLNLTRDDYWKIYKTHANEWALTVSVLLTCSAAWVPFVVSALNNHYANNYGFSLSFIGIILLILNSINLSRSNKMIKKYYGVRRIQNVPEYNAYLAQCKQYKKAKRAADKERFKFWVEKAYYDEGVRRKRSA